MRKNCGGKKKFQVRIEKWRDFLVKKIGLLFLIFLLVFSPVSVLAETAEVESDENAEAADGSELEADNDEEHASDPADEETSSEPEEPEVNAEENLEAEASEREEKKTEENTPDATQDDSNAEEQTTAEEAESDATDEGQAESEDTEEEPAVETISSEELELLHGADAVRKWEDRMRNPIDNDECALGKNTDGLMTGSAYLNDAGYYELALTTTIFNCYQNPDDDGYVGFKLPEGIEVIEQLLPEGVEVHDGSVYINYPEIASHDHVTIETVIPVNGEAGEAVQDRAGRYLAAQSSDGYIWIDNLTAVAIDFSEVEPTEVPDIPEDPDNSDTPETEEIPLQDATEALDGAITGGITGFDVENGTYNLELDVAVTNSSDQPVIGEEEIYVGFVIPEGLTVIQNDENVIGLDVDNNSQTIEEILVSVPLEGTIEPGEMVSRTVNVPLLGLAGENVSDSPLALYRSTGLGFEPVIQLSGNTNIDFSAMNEEWSFSAKSQIVRNFPGLEGNYFGLQFAFNLQNLTIEDADQVSVEFIVPDGMVVHEPDAYTEGSIPAALEDFLSIGTGSGEDLDITWDGNTATINLDVVEGASGYEGFFSAYGESSQSIDQLEGLQVVVTLYQNGDEVAKELFVPFEIVNYEGESEEPEENEDKEQDPAPVNGGNGITPGKGDQNSQEDNDKQGTPSKDADERDTNGSTDADEDNVTIGEKSESKSGSDDDSDQATTTATDSDDNTLPQTATNMFNILLAGVLLIALGAGIVFIRKRKTA